MMRIKDCNGVDLVTGDAIICFPDNSDDVLIGFLSYFLFDMNKTIMAVKSSFTSKIYCVSDEQNICVIESSDSIKALFFKLRGKL